MLVSLKPVMKPNSGEMFPQRDPSDAPLNIEKGKT